MTDDLTFITVGVLALQGAFNEHIQLLRQATQIISSRNLLRRPTSWTFLEIRTETELNRCDALIIPGGESTSISLVAQRSNLLEPLRDFVKVRRRPTWGTCAGLILLSESANRTKAGGQELIGGLDVRVNRNHFGRQIESFQADLELPFLRQAVGGDGEDFDTAQRPFKAIFIRAPVVEKILPAVLGVQEGEASVEGMVVAPSCALASGLSENLKDAPVEILATLPGRAAKLAEVNTDAGDIVAVRQGNVFGTSFHPELTGDARIHVWWLEEVERAFEARSVR